MKSLRAIPLALGLALAGVGMAQAQQPYPKQFADQWSSACLSSCQTNTLYKGREQQTCASYCGCILEEAQANVPLEVAMQADKDLAAKNYQSDAVKRVNQVTNQCQSRFAPQTPPGRQTRTTR